MGKENLNEYLGQPNVAACGGSWICPALVDAGDWTGITRLCREAVAEMHGFQLLHIGLNSRDEQEARANCEAFAGLFGFPVIELPGAFFAGTAMEVVKAVPGRKGTSPSAPTAWSGPWPGSNAGAAGSAPRASPATKGADRGVF